MIIGGPNGAGKTTAAAELLPDHVGVHEFVNADEIARGLSPLNPEAAAFAAGRLMLRRMQELQRDGMSFAFETTCAAVGHARLAAACRAAGYRITLLFLWLPSADAAVARVAQRAALGGHTVATDVIRRRYAGGLRNMRHSYLPLADIALIYDSAGGRALIAEQGAGGLVIHDVRIWQRIEEMTT